MKKLLKIVSLLFLLIMGISLSACATKEGSQTSNSDSKSGHVKSTTAITEVFGDGQKVSAVALEYDKDIDNSKLTQSTFSVEGRTITKVYANNEAAKTSQGVNGKYVIIELSTDEKSAYTLTQVGDESAGAPSAGGPPNNGNDTNSGSNQETSGPPDNKAVVKASVTQVENVVTSNGVTYAPSSEVYVNDKAINLVVDEFKQLEFKDEKYGKTLMYNLYIPKDYDKDKSYPLVLFMPDSTATSTDPIRTLIQGNGGTIWATESEQAKHESFVLCPQYSEMTVDDSYQPSDQLDITIDLLNSLMSQYNIDKNRIYNTGQSGGCMMSIAMDIKYPNLFAASMLVAGQWDTTKVAPMAKQNLWIIVSEGDVKAFPGMNSITTALENSGAKVSRATWNGKASADEFASDVSKITAENSNIKYTALKKGTVVSDGLADNALYNHIGTWRIAYNIEGIRDWLFTQKKTSK